jgi:cellulose biosynthesis protein BcsQ
MTLNLHERGVRVALLDTDHEQRTSSKWIQRAAPTIPVALSGKPQDIKAAIRDLKQSADLIIVDTPGSASPASFTATLLADIAIVPLQPSETDVDALDKALAAISVAHEATRGMKPETFIVMTCTALRDVQARCLRRELEANLPHTVARSEIRRFVLLRGAMGKSLAQLKGRDARKAEADLNSLIHEVLGGKAPGIAGAMEPQCLGRVANE